MTQKENRSNRLSSRKQASSESTRSRRSKRILFSITRKSAFTFVIGFLIGFIVCAGCLNSGLEIGIGSNTLSLPGSDPYLECLHRTVVDAKKHGLKITLLDARAVCLPLERGFGRRVARENEKNRPTNQNLKSSAQDSRDLEALHNS